ncbi:LacI family DNA-binding transcriptional regulator [Pontibacter harenae]|uniref:LacI family DNA-binding transcriptional regulator n=1 Tax=Pontibacter harenae TaxID=2894083 RepID=UPI001E61A651|nr:LacI family DNA-binding transcriptional regulator [Pontibacter harenae]MCC9168196.1 LacI family transcriptional regulator [Pontibacter harenae]
MKKPTPYTIKDIAAELGISVSTVSRALNNHPHISDKTKAKVKDLASKSDYRHNALAAGLRSNKSNIIGLIVPKISMFFPSTVVTAIQDRLHEKGYNLMICQSNDSPALEKELVNVLYSSRVEGLIVSTTLYTEDFSYFDIFSRAGIPLMFYDRVPKSYPAHKIKGDEYTGGYLSTLHLLEQGCRRIAHITGPTSCSIYEERYQGYTDALKKYGIAVDESMVFFHELTWENAMRACEEVFAAEPFPDAIFACNDTSAISVTEHAKRVGLKIPEDLKITGYSNDPRTQIIEPAITSVEQFPYEVGRQAASLMLELIQDKERYSKSFVSFTTPVELEKRASSGVNSPFLQ